MRPPALIDGAQVLRWAWSDDPPFLVMRDTDGLPVADICGLAIATYEDGSIYRFSCDRGWEVMNDSAHESEQSALSAPSAAYDVGLVRWQRAGAPR